MMPSLNFEYRSEPSSLIGKVCFNSGKSFIWLLIHWENDLCSSLEKPWYDPSWYPRTWTKSSSSLTAFLVLNFWAYKFRHWFSQICKTSDFNILTKDFLLFRRNCLFCFDFRERALERRWLVEKTALSARAEKCKQENKQKQTSFKSSFEIPSDSLSFPSFFKPLINTRTSWFGSWYPKRSKVFFNSFGGMRLFWLFLTIWKKWTKLKKFREIVSTRLKLSVLSWKKW